MQFKTNIWPNEPGLVGNIVAVEVLLTDYKSGYLVLHHLPTIGVNCNRTMWLLHRKGRFQMSPTILKSDL